MLSGIHESIDQVKSQFYLILRVCVFNLEFNSALGNQTYFYQKCGSCTQKSNET